MVWDLNVLKQAVISLYGADYLTELTFCLNSIVERLEFCRYHFWESKDALDSFLHDKTDDKSLIRLILSNNTDVRGNFDECKFKAKAHIISLTQHLHSLSDILGHVIYYSFNLKKATKEREIYLTNVLKWLKADNSYLPVVDLLNNLTINDNYTYLNAVVNHSKHRSIIEPCFNVNLQKTGKDMQEMKFIPFSYNNISYPTQNAFSFLESEFNRESQLIIEIGNEINRSLVSHK